MNPEELAQRSADEILRVLGRDEATLQRMLGEKQRGGWRWTEEELRKELVLSGVVRILKTPEPKAEEPHQMNPAQLQKEIQKTMDRLFVLRKELSRKTGDMPGGRKDVNFEKYVTE